MIHRALIPLVSCTRSTAVATGVRVANKQQLGNKGGVGISFKLAGTSFLFVNAHLAAHQGEVDKRNGEFAKISSEIARAMGGDGGGGGGGGGGSKPGSVVEGGAALGGVVNPLLDCFDNVFWSGDMNYRINGTRQVVDVLLSRGMHGVLVNNDQLSLAMKTNAAFEGFSEGPLNFKPTYKFDRGTDDYDSSKKQRIPSWTDRILYSSSGRRSSSQPPPVLLNYSSANNLRTSDHRPVYGSFRSKIFIEEGEGYGGEIEGMGLSQSQVCLVS